MHVIIGQFQKSPLSSQKSQYVQSIRTKVSSKDLMELATDTHVVSRRASDGILDVVHIDFQMCDSSSRHGEDDICWVFFDKFASSRDRLERAKAKWFTRVRSL